MISFIVFKFFRKQRATMNESFEYVQCFNKADLHIDIEDQSDVVEFCQRLLAEQYEEIKKKDDLIKKLTEQVTEQVRIIQLTEESELIVNIDFSKQRKPSWAMHRIKQDQSKLVFVDRKSGLVLHCKEDETSLAQAKPIGIWDNDTQNLAREFTKQAIKYSVNLGLLEYPCSYCDCYPACGCKKLTNCNDAQYIKLCSCKNTILKYENRKCSLCMQDCRSTSLGDLCLGECYNTILQRVRAKQDAAQWLIVLKNQLAQQGAINTAYGKTTLEDQQKRIDELNMLYPNLPG